MELGESTQGLDTFCDDLWPNAITRSYGDPVVLHGSSSFFTCCVLWYHSTLIRVITIGQAPDASTQEQCRHPFGRRRGDVARPPLSSRRSSLRRAGQATARVGALGACCSSHRRLRSPARRRLARRSGFLAPHEVV